MKQRKLLAVLLGLGLLSFFGRDGLERNFLFYPSHHQRDNELKEWKVDGRVIGYSRQVSVPENVWLMLHGNTGQAADRTYALASFSKFNHAAPGVKVAMKNVGEPVGLLYTRRQKFRLTTGFLGLGLWQSTVRNSR